MRKLPLAMAFGLALLFERSARADGLGDLEKSLNEQHEALTTSDCTTACQALASIRRAADRICALEPGARCVAAQAKVFEDTRKVRDACPQCAAATTTPLPESTPKSEAPPPPSPTAVSAQSEPGRGGCASCETGGVAPADLGAAGLGALALVRLLRRRRQATSARSPSRCPR